MFIKVEVEGAEKLKKDKIYLFMANHVSLFDVPFLKAYIPAHVVGVEAHHQFNWPIYGWLIKRLKTIPIRRDNIHASMKSIKKALQVLHRGTSLIILPEGHRTLDGKMREFKKLPFYLAKKAEVDLVPIGLSGLFSLKPKKSWHIRPGKIKIKFGKIITSDQIKKMEVEEIRDLTYDRIKSLIEWI
ncbi:MAG: 1-acyl-sn-glycerol-3-phosphate acyltransferase [Candidatus Cloacimonetes bacterium]|nr:1-acyl-sn-glycerol-3-phosphate acyltransferase [Candidatus Cloacimonadota bacterium]MCF7813988.1 1-acyl-sn-glycerol-3-phosphate acyltransferase [Candidatus Cloacimonadota bacterium]MCF7868616.1 1-acyl-sn-glycerol-3-phosphate acyltransferase [Candidatus Cloacimonadota bacterium]